MKKLGIYIHIPFCEKKCNYCNFISFVGKQNCFNKYIEVLCKEIEQRANVECIVDTIYIGGGTPSVLPSFCVQNILGAIKKNFIVDSQAEITIEANPNSITEEKAKDYLKLGINRISLGVQSLKQSCLKVLGRLHNAKQAKNTLKMLKKVGFNNINCDLMLAIPHLHCCDIIREIKFLNKYCFHISAYSLILEQGTPLYKYVQEKSIKLPSEKSAIAQYKIAVKECEKLGFHRYEVSNFAMSGFQSKHNLKYWNLDEYLGFGVASHSFYMGMREQNPENLQDYFALIEENKRDKKIVEEVTNESLKEECIMLALRKSEGINIIEFNKKFKCNLLIDKKEQIRELLALGLIETKGEFLRATDSGFYVLNQIILKLID